MPRKTAKVTEADISCAIRAMRSAGIARVRVRLDEKGAVVEADTGDDSARGHRRGPEPDDESIESEPLVLL